MMLMACCCRLLLCKPDGQLSNSQDNLPFVLQKLDRDGSILKGPPGMEVSSDPVCAWMRLWMLCGGGGGVGPVVGMWMLLIVWM